MELATYAYNVPGHNTDYASVPHSVGCAAIHGHAVPHAHEIDIKSTIGGFHHMPMLDMLVPMSNTYAVHAIYVTQADVTHVTFPTATNSRR